MLILTYIKSYSYPGGHCLVDSSWDDLLILMDCLACSSGTVLLILDLLANSRGTAHFSWRNFLTSNRWLLADVLQNNSIQSKMDTSKRVSFYSSIGTFIPTS